MGRTRVQSSHTDAGDTTVAVVLPGKAGKAERAGSLWREATPRPGEGSPERVTLGLRSKIPGP